MSAGMCFFSLSTLFAVEQIIIAADLTPERVTNSRLEKYLLSGLGCPLAFPRSPW